jgi:K(+)-stimulated pyrophosphate-energized sodium pump
MELIYIILSTSILAIVVAAWNYYSVLKKDSGNKKMQEISALIHKGALTFLNKEYVVMISFVALAFCGLFFFIGRQTAVAFLVGALFSALSGQIGMRIATKANAKTACAAQKSLNSGLRIAFSSGTVMGLAVVGLGLFGIILLYQFFHFAPAVIYGFGFGASSIALFARVGGGIYTKAADVGADLVGKVEAGIPEDDPRNPAVIADNVGDNVGDVAGMGADLFESYVDAIIAAMVIGVGVTTLTGNKGVILPMLLAGIGIISSIIGTFFVRTKEGHDPSSALDTGIFVASLLMAVASFFVIRYYTGEYTLFFSTFAGLVSGIVIGVSAEHYTSSHKKPVRLIAEASQTGAGTTVIQGLANGMFSTIIPILSVCAAILLSYKLGGGLYGIALAGVGMLSTLGITLATDTYAPVADNAAGISEMAKLGKKVRERCESLDAVGNTTAAIGKGFAIGSAALTALALFVSYAQVAHLTSLDITDPLVIIGLFIGALLPFVFCAFALEAVGRAASEIVNEVRRQFKTIPGLMKGKAKPDYTRCIGISTNAALKQMIAPSIITVATPLLVGKFLGIQSLGGLLVGSTVTGFLLAVFMANAGGAWDNAKKYIEEGNLGGKGSYAHKAAVVGDTVGDPFKDTAGPSLNILIKLISIIALIALPLFM